MRCSAAGNLGGKARTTDELPFSVVEADLGQRVAVGGPAVWVLNLRSSGNGQVAKNKAGPGSQRAYLNAATARREMQDASSNLQQRQKMGRWKTFQLGLVGMIERER